MQQKTLVMSRRRALRFPWDRRFPALATSTWLFSISTEWSKGLLQSVRSNLNYWKTNVLFLSFMEIPLSSILMICQEMLLPLLLTKLKKPPQRRAKVSSLWRMLLRTSVNWRSTMRNSCHQTVQVQHPLIAATNQHLYPPMSHAKNQTSFFK